jgi:hypothetical protein
MMCGKGESPFFAEFQVSVCTLEIESLVRIFRSLLYICFLCAGVCV